MDPEKKKNKYNSIYIIFGLIFLFIIFAMNIWFLNSLNKRNPRGTIPPLHSQDSQVIAKLE